MKNKYFKDYTDKELAIGLASLRTEIYNAPSWVINVFEKAWNSFIQNEFSYDGATFVRERYSFTIFEVAAFVHDWLNSKGYVGKNTDKLMFMIMEELDYPNDTFIWRKLYTMLTFLNVIRHKYFLKDYISDIDLKEYTRPLKQQL